MTSSTDTERKLPPLTMLRLPAAVRDRCWMLLAGVELGKSPLYELNGPGLTAVTVAVADLVRRKHANLVPPLDTCWLTLRRQAPDDLEKLADALQAADAVERARSGFDLALLDTTVSPSGGSGSVTELMRAYAEGSFSADPDKPLRLDPKGLNQWLDSAPGWIDEVPCAVTRLKRLAGCLNGDEGTGEALPFRGLLNRLIARANNGTLSALQLLDSVHPLALCLHSEGAKLGGTSLGDVWRHPAIRTGDKTRELLPFHAFAQRLSLSFVEPLAEAGITVTELGQLTAPATHQICSDFLTLGVIRCRHTAIGRLAHPTSSDIVVELRALSVALADRLADHLCAELRITTTDLPVVRILDPLHQVAADWPIDPNESSHARQITFAESLF